MINNSRFTYYLFVCFKSDLQWMEFAQYVDFLYSVYLQAFSIPAICITQICFLIFSIG